MAVEVGFAQTVANGVERKIMIVLDASESFFLRGGDDLAINNQAGRGVVIERRDTKNAYHTVKRSPSLEQCVDERRNGRTLRQHQQSSNQPPG